MISCQSIRPIRPGQRLPQLVALIACAMVTAGGCGKSIATRSDAPPVSADTVLQTMIQAYRSAATYQDRGIVRLSYSRDGRTLEDEAPLSVSWQGPNRVHIQAYQVRVTCDSQTLNAQIQDAESRNFDGQIVQRPAPARLSLADLYEQDEILALAFRQGLTGYPLQLDLLLGAEPLAALRSAQATRQLLEPSNIDGCPCHRVAVDTSDGRVILWIDCEAHLLRRAEYPVATFARDLAEDTSVEDARLTAEFRGATFGGRIADETFAMSWPPQAKRVRKFVPPSRELPSELIGQTTATYAFADLQGTTVSSESLGDRIKVFLWFGNHPACQSSVRQLNQVYQQYKSQPQVAIYAVCIEPAAVANTQVAELLRLWQVEVPVVRDIQACGRDVFGIPWAPTMVVLDTHNVLHIFEVGANPNLVAELPQVLERLVAGENLAGEIREQFRQARRAYEQAVARGEPAEVNETTGTAPAASPTSPTAMSLRPAWTNQDLKAAGNILALEDDARDTRFLVQDGDRTIVELDTAGRVLARQDLDLPDNATVTQLQSSVDGKQRRYFVAWALRGAQVHLFDSQWHRLLSYPSTSVPHDGVQDALLTDLDANGSLELCTGFWGTAGVHCTSLDGNLIWTNQQASHVLSLLEIRGTPTPAKPQRLWVASASGQIVPLDHRGQAGKFDDPSGQLIHHIFGAGSSSLATIPYCGITYGTDGRRLAVGLTPEPRSQWRYNLPPGSFPTEVRFVAAASLLGSTDRQWLIAGPEGSLHVISQDGKFTDFFQTGSSLTGVAGGHCGSQGMLVVSTGEGVRAWHVAPPVAQTQDQPAAASASSELEARASDTGQIK